MNRFFVFSRMYSFCAPTYTTSHSSFAEAYKEIMDREHDFNVVLSGDNAIAACVEFVRLYNQVARRPHAGEA